MENPAPATSYGTYGTTPTGPYHTLIVATSYGPYAQAVGDIYTASYETPAQASRLNQLMATVQTLTTRVNALPENVNV